MKFEMNCWTVGLLDKEGLIVNKGLVERQMTLLGYRVSINTNKPDGIVQLGRDSIDLTYTDNIRGSLGSLVYAAKRREGGMLGRGLRRKEDYLQVFRGDSQRASGRTFRALLDVMKTASESPEGSLTLFVVLNGNEVYSSYSQLTHVMGRMLGNVLNDNKTKTLTFENRTIQVVSKNKMNFMCFDGHETGKRINVVYDHTVQGN